MPRIRPSVTVIRKPSTPDPENLLTTVPIDVAFSRGRITAEQHAAARRYAELNDDPARVGELQRAREAVRRACGSHMLIMLDSLVITQQWPSWVWASNKASLMAHQAKAMETAGNALDALAGHFSGL